MWHRIKDHVYTAHTILTTPELKTIHLEQYSYSKMSYVISAVNEFELWGLEV